MLNLLKGDQRQLWQVWFQEQASWLSFISSKNVEENVFLLYNWQMALALFGQKGRIS